MRRFLTIVFALFACLVPFSKRIGYEAHGGVQVTNGNGDQQKAEKKKAPTIEPELDRCTLEVNGRSLKPASISPFSRGHAVGDAIIRIEENVVQAFKTGDADGKPRWTDPRGLSLLLCYATIRHAVMNADCNRRFLDRIGRGP